MIKIAIIGKMCAGKSTISNKIIDYYKKRDIIIKKRSFSEPIYHIAKTIFGMKKKNRKLLQQIGTKIREINKNVFVDYIINDISENTIIDDCRFINELNALYKAGFTIIKINIPKDIQKERIIKTYPETWKNHIENLNHQSETTIENMDSRKINNIINYDYEIIV